MIPRIFKTWLIAPALLSLSLLTVSAQTRLTGKVVEVVDGRTVAMETSAGRMTVRLQFIEVPEPEQPLHAVVRQHLAKFVTGRMADLVVLRIVDGVTVGRLSVGDVDLSAQMILDGAAWHEPPGFSGQTADEAAEYANLERAAKAAARGVWGVAGMKAPWQVRKERQEAADRADAVRRSKMKVVVGVNQFQTANRRDQMPEPGWRPAGGRGEYDAWGDLYAGVGTEHVGLHTYTDPQGRFSSIYTSAVFVSLASGSARKRLESRLMYVEVGPAREKVYAIGFRYIGKDFYFSRKPSVLSFAVDRKIVNVGRPLTGFIGQNAAADHEIFYYRLTKAQMKSLAAARTVDVRIDGLSAPLSADGLQLFRQLYETVQ